MRQKKNGLENLVLITQLGLNVVTPKCIEFRQRVAAKLKKNTKKGVQ